MRARAQKWGNSLAVRIPKAIAQQAGVHPEDELDIDVEANVIRLRPLRRTPCLAELLQRITAENVHGEIDPGPARGREIW